MTTIYVVTSGRFSDYRVRALFSTRELAQEHIDGCGKAFYVDDAGIEEWELDVPVEGRLYRRVNMRKNGDVHNTSVEWLDPTVGPLPDYFFKDRGWDSERKKLIEKGPPILAAYIDTEEEERAIKVANERRTTYLVAGHWGQTFDERPLDGLIDEERHG